VIAVPTAEQLAAASRAFDADWGGVDEVLYRLCTESPGHLDRRTVTAKLALVGRAYSAGLERCVTPPKGTQAITIIADFVHARGATIDAVMKPVLSIEEPLTIALLEGIVAAHGAFLGILSGVTAGKMPRSFAAKYLHFHNPVVPIYDEYARAGLTHLVHWDSKNLPFEPPEGADREYYKFCVRFWRLYRACSDASVAASVKTLDQYLWAVPTVGT